MNHATRRLPRAVVPVILGGYLATTTLSQHEQQTKLDYWQHNRNDFDVYIENPVKEDLPRLLKDFQSGKEVWPWIWCQPNENGPHHVFVGETLTESVLHEIQTLLQNPNNNILIVTSPEYLAIVPPKLVERCGIVTDAKVELINTGDKILMLDDERVIAFDRLVVT
jgi:hypothetical protein